MTSSTAASSSSSATASSLADVFAASATLTRCYCIAPGDRAAATTPAAQQMAKQYLETVVQQGAVVALQFPLPGPVYRHAGHWIQLSTGLSLGQEPARPAKIAAKKWADGLITALVLGWLAPIGHAEWLINSPVVVAITPEGRHAIGASPDPVWEAQIIASVEGLVAWAPLLANIECAVRLLDGERAGLSPHRASNPPVWPIWPANPVGLDPVLLWIEQATAPWRDLTPQLALARFAI